MSKCWSCSFERGGSLVCPECNALQPLDSKATDYFSALGLPRQMSISRTDLDRAFRTVAKQVHPDRFSRDEPEKRKQALHHTELVNVAYKTLKNSQKRAEYLLELGGFQVASETDRTEDKSFLLRLLEKQELLDEAKDIATIASLKRETTDRQKTLVARVTQFFDANKDNSSLAIVDGVGPENVRKSLVELRYLRRLLDHIAVKEEELF